MSAVSARSSIRGTRELQHSVNIFRPTQILLVVRRSVCAWGNLFGVFQKLDMCKHLLESHAFQFFVDYKSRLLIASLHLLVLQFGKACRHVLTAIRNEERSHCVKTLATQPVNPIHFSG